MKLIKITFTKTNTEIDAAFDSMSELVSTMYKEFLHTINYSEYVRDNVAYLYTAIDDADLYKLTGILDQFAGGYAVEDITTEALYGDIDTKQFEVQSENGGLPSNAVSVVVESFIDANLTTDVVLEKILDLGSESLSDKDIEVLENGEVLNPVLPFKFIVSGE